MKNISEKIFNVLNQKNIRSISKFMMIICYIVIGFLALSLILSLLGRLEYHVIFADNDYPYATFSQENNELSTGIFTSLNNGDNLRIHTQSDVGKIELVSYIAIVIIHALNIIPLIFAYFFLSKVFGNVARREIFVEKNASYLLYFGIIQLALTLILPFLKMLIVAIANIITTDIISLSTGSEIINNIIPIFGFLVAAYIINYGVNLQDEVDHTL